MEEEEGIVGERYTSTAALLIFFLLCIFQLAFVWLQELKKRASVSDKEVQLRGEIKQLLKEATTLSQPSTFAQAAKLRRTAAAKEKDLTTYQEQRGKEMKMSYDLYLNALFMSKVVTYLFLVVWFWRSPVATISSKLVQPLGSFLSFLAGGPAVKEYVKVGIIPWLILSTRVSGAVCQLLMVEKYFQ